MKKNRKTRSRATGHAAPEDVDVPELSDEELARAVPFKKGLPGGTRFMEAATRKAS